MKHIYILYIKYIWKPNYSYRTNISQEYLVLKIVFGEYVK